ncbi:MAG: tetratricopeptide repeat protein [Nannocystaceae bacterium]
MAFSKEKAHERAEKFAAKGQHDKAAREYQTIVENDPKDIRAWLMLADCLVRCGDRNGAIERYLQVAGYYAAQQQPQKAMAVYRQVVNLDPRRFDVHQKIAQLNLDLGRVPDAVAIYEQLGQAQLQAGNVSEALATFELIANAEPAAIPKRLRLAELYSRERMVDKAVEHFRIAGDQLLATGRKADYVRVAERLIYHKPDDPDSMRKLARVYLELGDARRALMKLNALLHADAHDRIGLELLAETFLALEKPDKATSVALELVRQLKAQGDSGAAEAARVATRALQWDPNHSELRAIAMGDGAAAPPRPRTVPPEPTRPTPVAAPVATAPPMPTVAEASDEDEVEDEVVEADDLLELDEDDVIPSDSTSVPLPTGGGRGVRERNRSDDAPSRSMTDRVLSDVAGISPAVPDGVDLDKILFEARVYVKYRLFEHAIEHVSELLAVQPDHVGALALRARALGELGRRSESAEAHIRVARLVVDRDPKLAREHLGAALDADANSAAAMDLLADLDARATPEGGGTQRGSSMFAGSGDSGAFDLVGDEGSGINALEPDTSVDDFAIDVSEGEPEAAPTRPIAVENRFGLSDARPLPTAEGGDGEHRPTEDLAEALAAMRSGADAPDKTPPFAYNPRAPSDAVVAPTESLDLDAPPDGSTARFYPQSPPRSDATAPPGAALSEPSVDFELDDATAPDGDAGEHPTQPVVPRSVTPSSSEEQPVPTPPRPPPPRRPSSPAAKPAWPDLSDELAEVRFFVDQGLDDDAQASLAELERRHPGHPDVAALKREFEKDTAAPPQHSGAKPLVSVGEDEEEDAYLSAIFGEAPKAKPAAAKPKARAPEIRATGSDPGDAASAYDLGMAYRDMGLVDDAIAQFELAAHDASWEARALVMSGALRLHRGEPERAVADLQRAIGAASNEDELYEAKYELATVYEKIGDNDAAIAELIGIPQGYRERDDKLAALGG